MFIAMNRFKIAQGKEADFEKIWRERESYLDKVSGFISFSLLKRETNFDHILYASHTTWASKQAFTEWTESDYFRRAHAQKSAPPGTLLGHPELETFAAVIE